METTLLKQTDLDLIYEFLFVEDISDEGFIEAPTILGPLLLEHEFITEDEVEHFYAMGKINWHETVTIWMAHKSEVVLTRAYNTIKHFNS